MLGEWCSDVHRTCDVALLPPRPALLCRFNLLNNLAQSDRTDIWAVRHGQNTWPFFWGFKQMEAAEANEAIDAAKVGLH